MKILPLGKEILVKPFEEKQYIGEIKCEYGDVLAVGSEVTKVKVGQTIGYRKWGTNELEVKGENFLFISEDSDFLLCLIEEL